MRGRDRLGTEHRSQNKNVFQTSAEQKQNNRTKFPNKANGPNKTTEQKATSERLKTNSPRTSNKIKAEQNKKTPFTAMPGVSPPPGSQQFQFIFDRACKTLCYWPTAPINSLAT